LYENISIIQHFLFGLNRVFVGLLSSNQLYVYKNDKICIPTEKFATNSFDSFSQKLIAIVIINSNVQFLQVTGFHDCCVWASHKMLLLISLILTWNKH